MSVPGTVIAVSSPEHLQSLLSGDLGRLSVLSFRADWAEPCKQMDAAIRELAKAHPKALFLEIEAEALPDISESFEVESVPYFVLLRGHTLLDQIEGAQAVALSNAINKHIAPKPAPPQSSTSQRPAAPPTTAPAPRTNGSTAPSAASESSQWAQKPAPANETPDQLDRRCDEIMNQSEIVLFMKGNPDVPRCGFSKTTIGILRDLKLEFTTFDILQDEAVRQHMKVKSEWPTFPQLIVKGEFVGGLDIVKEMVESGELQELVA